MNKTSIEHPTVCFVLLCYVLLRVFISWLWCSQFGRASWRFSRSSSRRSSGFRSRKVCCPFFSSFKAWHVHVVLEITHPLVLKLQRKEVILNVVIAHFRSSVTFLFAAVFISWPSRTLKCLLTYRIIPIRSAWHLDTVNDGIFFNGNIWIWIKNSLKFVPKGSINDIPSLVQIMVWHQPGNKQLSEPIMVISPTHICVTWHQWVEGHVCWEQQEKMWHLNMGHFY